MMMMIMNDNNRVNIKMMIIMVVMTMSPNKLAICLKCQTGAHRFDVIQSRGSKRVADFDVPA
jgi:hypothetical protein